MPDQPVPDQSAIFHLSLHVSSLDTSRQFYAGLLGCKEGRSTADWVDFDFFGHQLSLHKGSAQATTPTGEVDGVAVPMPHFGAVLPASLWDEVADRLQAAKVDFVLAPQTRYAGQSSEQRTLFLYDPSGNAIELKSMRTAAELFELAAE